MIGPAEDNEFETFDEALMMELDNDIGVEPMGIDQAFDAPAAPKQMMPAKPLVMMAKDVKLYVILL